MSQSTNDAYPTGFRLGVYYAVQSLLEELDKLQKALRAKGDEFADIIKMGRTQLQDAVPMTLGQAVIGFSFVVLLLWIPLREKPGVGTIANALVVGLAADATLALMEEPHVWWLRILLLVAGVILNGLATALYIGAQLGRGPRDGLMTGLAARTGCSNWRPRPSMTPTRSTRRARACTATTGSMLAGTGR